MDQYISKSAIVAEIEKQIKEYSKSQKEHPDCEYYDGAVEALEEFKDEFLNTLEAKEVDLEKEIQAFAKMDLYPIELSDTNLSIVVTKHQIYKCARHFFELGLKAKEGKE